MVDRYVSVGGELWASAQLNIPHSRRLPLPQMVLEQLGIPLFPQEGEGEVEDEDASHSPSLEKGEE